MTADEIREQIEADVVALIKTKVENEEMTEERAQQIAQRILDMLKPGMTLEELFKVLPQLDDNFSEIGHIIVPYLKDYEEGVTKRAAKTVHDLIMQGQYKEAQDLANRVIKQDVKLVWTGSAGSPTKPQ
jgi:hypothetical protein